MCMIPVKKNNTKNSRVPSKGLFTLMRSSWALSPSSLMNAGDLDHLPAPATAPSARGLPGGPNTVPDIRPRTAVGSQHTPTRGSPQCITKSAPFSPGSQFLQSLFPKRIPQNTAHFSKWARERNGFSCRHGQGVHGLPGLMPLVSPAAATF